MYTVGGRLGYALAPDLSGDLPLHVASGAVKYSLKHPKILLSDPLSHAHIDARPAPSRNAANMQRRAAPRGVRG